VQAKTFFFAEMMCKQLIFCIKAATRLHVGQEKNGKNKILDFIIE
jgi:hypothetical protein